MRGRWDAKSNPRDYGIEKPYWGPSNLTCHCLFVNYEDRQYSSSGDSGRVRRDIELFRDGESVATVGKVFPPQKAGIASVLKSLSVFASAISSCLFLH